MTQPVYIFEDKYDDASKIFPQFSTLLQAIKQARLHPKYLPWILKQLKTNPNLLIQSLVPPLTKFDELVNKNVLQGKDRDIGSYSDLNFLNSKLESTVDRQQTKQAQNQDAQNYTKVSETDRFITFQPNNQAASCKLGQNTKWCISATKTENKWDEYANSGFKFFFVFDKVGKTKYAIAYDPQFKYVQTFDATDTTINLSSLGQILDKDTINAINKKANHQLIDPAVIAAYLKKINDIKANPIIVETDMNLQKFIVNEFPFDEKIALLNRVWTTPSLKQQMPEFVKYMNQICKKMSIEEFGPLCAFLYWLTKKTDPELYQLFATRIRKEYALKRLTQLLSKTVAYNIVFPTHYAKENSALKEIFSKTNDMSDWLAKFQTMFEQKILDPQRYQILITKLQQGDKDAIQTINNLIETNYSFEQFVPRTYNQIPLTESYRLLREIKKLKSTLNALASPVLEE